MFGAPGTVRSPLAGKDMKKENISIKTTTTNPFGAPTNTPENSFGASLNSPNSSSNTPINAIINPFGPSISTDKAWLSLEPIVSSAMNNATSVSSTRSVPSTPSISRELGDSRTVIMPASSNLFGSSTAGFSFGSPSPTVATSSTAQISGQASVNGKSTFKTAPKSKIVSIFQQLTLLLAPHKAQSDIIHAPSPKRAKTVHSIAAQLPANEFTKKLDLFRGPEVHVTAGISLAVKSYRLPKALLLAASPFFETAIEVETIGSLSQEILRMDCSSVVFDLVVQYLYTGTFVCPSFLKKWEPQQLTILIEFYELAEKLSLDISEKVLDNIKQLLIHDCHSLLGEHIRYAMKFPNEHGLRKLFARSCIHAYLEFVNPNIEDAQVFRFKKEFDELDGFAADLMRVYEEVASKRTPGKFAESCDPLDGKMIYY